MLTAIYILDFLIVLLIAHMIFFIYCIQKGNSEKYGKSINRSSLVILIIILLLIVSVGPENFLFAFFYQFLALLP